jgi:hypothetical protein
MMNIRSLKIRSDMSSFTIGPAATFSDAWYTRGEVSTNIIVLKGLVVPEQ